MALAVVLFVFRMSRSLVRRTYRCGGIHSRTSRTAPEREFLERSGDSILVLELQGALFFGTGEKMLSDIEIALRHQTSCVILDMRRLTEIDLTGANILLELKSSLSSRHKAALAGRSLREASRGSAWKILARYARAWKQTCFRRRPRHRIGGGRVAAIAAAAPS